MAQQNLTTCTNLMLHSGGRRRGIVHTSECVITQANATLAQPFMNPNSMHSDVVVVVDEFAAVHIETRLRALISPHPDFECYLSPAAPGLADGAADAVSSNADDHSICLCLVRTWRGGRLKVLACKL